MKTDIIDEGLDARIRRGMITTVVSAVIGVSSLIGGCVTLKNNPYKDNSVIENSVTEEIRDLYESRNFLEYQIKDTQKWIKYYKVIEEIRMMDYKQEQLKETNEKIALIDKKITLADEKIAAANQTPEFQSYLAWEKNCVEKTLYGMLISGTIGLIAGAYTSNLKKRKEELQKEYSH